MSGNGTCSPLHIVIFLDNLFSSRMKKLFHDLSVHLNSICLPQSEHDRDKDVKRQSVHKKRCGFSSPSVKRISEIPKAFVTPSLCNQSMWLFARVYYWVRYPADFFFASTSIESLFFIDPY